MHRRDPDERWRRPRNPDEEPWARVAALEREIASGPLAPEVRALHTVTLRRTRRPKS